MGVEHYVYLIIGRMCTTEEADRIWNAMQDLDQDFQDWEKLSEFLRTEPPIAETFGTVNGTNTDFMWWNIFCKSHDLG